MYDLIFRGATVIDGTGSPGVIRDVAVREGKLFLPDAGTAARRVVDAAGMVLCPGFIDAHSHGDGVLGTEHGRLCKTSQGVTTEITGQCGETLYPVSRDPEKYKLLAGSIGSLTTDPPAELGEFTSLERFLQYAASQPLTANFKVLTGHAALRIAAMGFENRRPTDQEMETMISLLREAMEHGSMGLSSGLLYSPSGFADEEELVSLCEVIAPYDGIYATHMRNEAGGVLDSVQESISTASRAGVRLEISHHKICGKENWGLSNQTLALVEEANRAGKRVTMDVYPYTASMSNLNVCLPPAFFANGPEGMSKLLQDPEVRRRLAGEIEQIDGRYRHCGGFSGILVAGAPKTPEAEGLTVDEYAARVGKEPFDAFFDVVQANGHDAVAIYSSMCDGDLFRIVSHPDSVLGSDGVVRNLAEKTHPRGFGSFPRAIRTFVYDKGLLSLEAMIHKMTGLTARREMVPNKGFIREGYDADLVLFDPQTIRDRADFQHPLETAAGIELVLVNGTAVYENGALTGASPGRFVPHTKMSD